jgi:predicted acetyltransferase
LYFEKVYADDEILVYVLNDCPVASLQMIPYQIKITNNLYRGGYISGAMTHPNHRKKGYMDKLMQTSFDEMLKNNYDYAFLIPQNRGLVEMYAKYGFRLCQPNPNPPENIVVKTPKQWAQIQEDFFNENGVWLENEPFTPNEHKGMIKRLNPAVKEINTLYMGMMMD